MKQKIINYIEDLEQKAQKGEEYFKLWHKEYHKNKKAIEYIEKHKYCETSEYNDDYKEIEVNANKVLDILKGVDKE